MCTRRFLCTIGVAAVGLGLAACGEDAVITPPPTDNAPTMTLSAPAGGMAVAPGATVDIAWTATDDMGVTGVDLSYIADNTAATTIATGEVGSSYTWTAPSTTLFGVRIIAVASDSGGQTARDTTDNIFAIVESSARGYVTSDVCESCHETEYDNVFASGHPYKIVKVEGGVAPTYPYSTVPSPPVGYTWNDITYVIGGFGWKARFMDENGWIITDGFNGVNAQYNIPRAASDFPDLAADWAATWSSYHSADTEPKPYNCGTCHTTGWQTLADNGDVHQDGLVGIVGTWEEPGVGCEQCHGTGEDHVVSQMAADITIDDSGALCGTCHTRDAANRTLTSGGFIRHHEQYDEMLLAGHSALDCGDCHEPHILTRYDNAAAGGILASATCESCHAGQAATNDHAVPVDCETCHLPRATKSARALTEHEGDVRSHIFAIDPDAVDKSTMWIVDTDGKEIAGPAVTLDFVCYQCHQDENGVGGTMSQKTLAQLSAKATGIHTP